MMQNVLDAALSTRCCLCGRRLVFFHHSRYSLCNPCANRIRPAPSPRCRICSMPLVSEFDLCSRCRNQHYEFESNYSLFVYGGYIQELIYQYKTRGVRDLAWLFCEHVAPVIEERYPGLPVVPVPYRPKRKRLRGWDQVRCVTTLLKKKHDISILPVLRRRNSIPQKRLNFEERKVNLANKIRLRRRQSINVPEVVLLDDVFTTGATGSECARVLKLAGVKKIYMITIALDR